MSDMTIPGGRPVPTSERSERQAATRPNSRGNRVHRRRLAVGGAVAGLALATVGGSIMIANKIQAANERATNTEIEGFLHGLGFPKDPDHKARGSIDVSNKGSIVDVSCGPTILRAVGFRIQRSGENNSIMEFSLPPRVQLDEHGTIIDQGTRQKFPMNNRDDVQAIFGSLTKWCDQAENSTQGANSPN